MKKVMTNQDLAVLYGADFFEWTQASAELLRQGRLDEADLQHIAEEIEDMGERDRREMRSGLTISIAHLLQGHLQPERRGLSLRRTITEQRRQLTLVFRDSPSLVSAAGHELPSIYVEAVQDAISETGLSPDCFPSTCPYSEENILDSRFLPD
jgi:hypothetical protein